MPHSSELTPKLLHQSTAEAFDALRTHCHPVLLVQAALPPCCCTAQGARPAVAAAALPWCWGNRPRRLCMQCLLHDIDAALGSGRLDWASVAAAAGRRRQRVQRAAAADPCASAAGHGASEGRGAHTCRVAAGPMLTPVLLEAGVSPADSCARRVAVSAARVQRRRRRGRTPDGLGRAHPSERQPWQLWPWAARAVARKPAPT